MKAIPPSLFLNKWTYRGWPQFGQEEQASVTSRGFVVVSLGVFLVKGNCIAKLFFKLRFVYLFEKNVRDGESYSAG